MAPASGCNVPTNVTFTLGDPTNDIIPDGSAAFGGTVKFTCSVVPAAAGGFTLDGRAEIIGNVAAAQKGTFSVKGTVFPKAMQPSSPNMYVALTTGGETFTQTGCTFYFQGLDKNGTLCMTQTTDPGDGSVICTANPNMDVAAGKIWGSVVCEQGNDSAQNPPRTCKTAITFRFENCTQQGSSG
jgi:hypothetical protein